MAIRIYVDVADVPKVLDQMSNIDQALKAQCARAHANLASALDQYDDLVARIERMKDQVAAQDVIDGLVPEVRVLLELLPAVESGEDDWMRSVRAAVRRIGDRLGEVA
jgi:hypothetical protein